MQYYKTVSIFTNFFQKKIFLPKSLVFRKTFIYFVKKLSIMANTVWKYTLDLLRSNTIEIPKDGKVLTVGEQQGTLCIWVKVDDSLEKEQRIFKIFGTGHLIPDYGSNLQYINSVQIDSLVFHVFEFLNETYLPK